MSEPKIKKEWNSLVDTATKYPARLQAKREHPTKLTNTLFQLNSEISEFLSDALKYIQSQHQCLLTHLETNAAIVGEYSDKVRPHLRATSDALSQLFKDAEKEHTSAYSDTPLYNKALDEISQVLRRNSTNIQNFFKTSVLLLDKAVSDIGSLSVHDPAELYAFFSVLKADYAKTDRAKAILKSYRQSELRGLRQADGKAAYYHLKAEYAANPAVTLYNKYCSEPTLFCSELRRSICASDTASLSGLLEYLMKFEALSAKVNLGDSVHFGTEPLVNRVFSGALVNTPERMAALKNWLGEQLEQCLRSNQHFIPYYALGQMQLLSTQSVPEYVAQLEEWFPERFKADGRKALVGAIYDESELWKTADGRYPSPAQLVPYVSTTKMRPTKSTLFTTRMKSAFTSLRDLLSSW